jgi:hypothetical protein
MVAIQIKGNPPEVKLSFYVAAGQRPTAVSVGFTVQSFVANQAFDSGMFFPIARFLLQKFADRKG